jgi:hypothetical protein
MEKISYLHNGQWVLEKGSRQKKIPFNPDKDISNKDRYSVQGWVTGDVTSSVDKQDIPRMSGNMRARALNKLMRLAQYRKNPITNKLEFLLHRGDNSAENYARRNKGDHYHNDEMTSWSWTPGIAAGFSHNASFGADAKPGDFSSAWVPEDDIHSMPKMYGHRGGLHEPDGAALGPNEPDEDWGSSAKEQQQSAYGEDEILVAPGKFKIHK